ncbi:MAG TPA: flagellar export protein FliJ [Paraburkholderia sp.]|jgi:flagellar FliJ protein
MPQDSPIKMLIDLAQDDVDAAAQRLGRAQRERNDIEAQLKALIEYRNEYHGRFTASAQIGIAAGNLRNFQAFIDTLDAAIEQQRKLLAAASTRLESAKPEWQRQKQKLGSYEVLQARGDAVEARKDARREQRDADESGARMSRMRTGDA